MIVPVLWGTSGYDGQCHAFPIGQAADRDRGFYEARCSHTVPPGQLTTTQGPTGPLCMACAAIVGSELPEPGRHGTAPAP